MPIEPQKADRINISRADGTVQSIPNTPEQIDAARAQGWAIIGAGTATATDETSQPVHDSWSTRAWNWINNGLMSPDQALAFITSHRNAGQTVTGMRAEANRPPTLYETPAQARERAFIKGLRASEADFMSSITSPVSIGTAALGAVTEGANAASKAVAPWLNTASKFARPALTALGLTGGVQGGANVIEGLDKGITTPEGAEKVLQGSTQLLGVVPAVHETARLTEAGLAKAMPAAFAKAERAFIYSMQPPDKDVLNLRRAYQRLQPRMQEAKVTDFYDLRDFAEQGRKASVAALSKLMLEKGLGTGHIDAVAVGDAVRNKITPWMTLRSGPEGVLPAEGAAIFREATNIERNLQEHPLTIPEAEGVVQNLNALLADFRKMSPGERYEAAQAGSPEAVIDAVKSELQGQIEAKVNGYKNLKADYGAYKEIQQQAERRLNQLEKAGAADDWTHRRVLEEGGGALGALFSGQYLRGLRAVLGGRALGDVALAHARNPQRALKRSLKPPLVKQPTDFRLQLLQPAVSSIGKERNDAENNEEQ